MMMKHRSFNRSAFWKGIFLGHLALYVFKTSCWSSISLLLLSHALYHNVEVKARTYGAIFLAICNAILS